MTVDADQSDGGTGAERTARQRRADILLSFAVRGIFGARAQRDRMARADVVTYDLDFYVFAAWQLREAGRQALDRLGIEEIRVLLDRLDDEIPLLKDYRDMMTHAIDDRPSLANVAWFGPFAANLQPGGAVEYVIDSRHHQHEALEVFFEGLATTLLPHGSGRALSSVEHVRGERLPPT